MSGLLEETSLPIWEARKARHDWLSLTPNKPYESQVIAYLKLLFSGEWSDNQRQRKGKAGRGLGGFQRIISLIHFWASIWTLSLSNSSLVAELEMAKKDPLPWGTAHEGSFNKVSLRKAKAPGLDMAKHLRCTPHGFVAHRHKFINLPGANGPDLILS